MAAIDEAPADAVRCLRMAIEVNPSRVLIEACGHHMLGLFDRDAIDVIDPLARDVETSKYVTSRQAPSRSARNQGPTA